MAEIDRRETIAKPFKQGSSRLAVGLTETQAQEIIDQAADPGWYVLGELEGGQIGPSRDTEENLNEAGEQVNQIVTRDEFIVGNTMMSTDDQTLKLLDWLEDHYVPARYPLPAEVDDMGVQLYQLWYFPHVTLMKEDWRINTTNETRTRDFQVKAVKRLGDPIAAFATVSLADETGWPTELEDAKSDVFSPVV